MEPEEFITIEAAARLLDMSISGVTNLIARGKLTADNPRGWKRRGRLLKRSAVEALQRERTEGMLAALRRRAGPVMISYHDVGLGCGLDARRRGDSFTEELLRDVYTEACKVYVKDFPESLREFREGFQEAF